MNGRASVDLREARDPRRRRALALGWPSGAQLAFFWALALLFHVLWVPNLVWLLAPPTDLARSMIEVTAVGVAPVIEAERGPGQTAERLAAPEIELPGMASGGSSSETAPARHDWERGAMEQRQVSAPRAPDWAPQLQVMRPHAPRGRPRAPAEIVAQLRAGTDDLWLAGRDVRSDSVLRRPGDRVRGERADDPGAAGTPSAGNRVAPGEGPFSIAAAGEGGGPDRRRAVLGGRPRQARPHVAEAQTSSDAERLGELAGLQASRQAAPELAWSSAPVREARRSSGDGPESDALAAGEVQRRDGQGPGREARGPAGGGRGRGTRGTGRDMSPLLESYRRDCMARISRYWSYPLGLAYDLQQGLVQVEIQIRHDGRVERVTVQRSSGFRAFDDNAVRAVRLASPFAPPPPEELFRHGRDSVVLRIPMRYRNPMFE